MGREAVLAIVHGVRDTQSRHANIFLKRPSTGFTKLFVRVQQRFVIAFSAITIPACESVFESQGCASEPAGSRAGPLRFLNLVTLSVYVPYSRAHTYENFLR